MRQKLLLFIVLTNVFLYAISFRLGLERPIINIDYVLVYLVFLSFGYHKALKVLAIVCMISLSAVDILLFVNQIFPFVQLGDFFYLSTFVFTGPLAYQKWLFIAVFYLIFTYIIGSVLFFVTHKRVLTKELAFYIVCSVIIALFNMDSIRSQTLFFITHYSEDYHKIRGSDELLSPNKYGSVSKSIFDNIQTNANGDKILLIVNESLGKATNPDIQAALLAPLYEHQLYYDYIEDGAFSFVGPTVSGELRELCQKNATVMDISRVEDKEFSNCLPALLREQGYDTYSVHGAAGGLYDRLRWYPLIGFNHVLFKEDFTVARDCKSFSGKCDYDLFEPIADIFTSKQKVMLYWLTLNTHAPYDDKLFVDGFNCQDFSLKENSEACLNFKQQYQFFYRLSEYVQDDRMKGVEVYVVGDHAPPIMSLKDNYSIYEDFDVSWIRFKVKEIVPNHPKSHSSIV